MNRKVLVPALLAVLSLASCTGGEGSASTVANKDKPLIWYNRQPSNSTTGVLDTAALNFNEDTYYVGFDANQGAELQGQMVVDYIKAHADTIDKNGDGTIGYVLAIGDVGHNDSIARTRGVRSALGTAVTTNGVIDADPITTDPAAVQEGSLTVGDKTFKVVELRSAEMKNSAGATWDATTAGNTAQTWFNDLGTQIDVVVSNNDGMGMAMFNMFAKANDIPTFGYDANSDAVAAIAEGYGGTISQHTDVQAYLTLRLLRNCFDNVDINTGISVADDAGNILQEGTDYKYVESERSFYALNLAVTADNYTTFLDATATNAAVSNQLDSTAHASKNVLLSTYNSADNFLGSTYNPLLQKYDDLLNLNVTYIAGDGQNESSITNRFVNLDSYDGFAINMVKTDNAASYTALLQ